MEKINKKYIAVAGALLLVGGVAVFATTAFASNAADSTSISSQAIGVSQPAVVDSPENGDTPDVSASTSSAATDSPEPADTPDSQLQSGTADTPEAGDTVDSGK